MYPGKTIYRMRWFILIGWVVACLLLYVLVPPGDPTKNERASFLPKNSPYRLAMEKLAKSFPQQCGLSQAAIVFERRDGKLSYKDNAYINNIAAHIRRPVKGGLSQEDLVGLTVTSPGLMDLAIGSSAGSDMMQKSFSMLGRVISKARKGKLADNGSMLINPLRSKLTKDGQAAIVRVNIPSGFITYRSSQIVKHIRDLLKRMPPPAGLKVAVTGTGGYGHDYAQFVKNSHDRTTIATLLAVVIILLIVYRAPLAAMVPLIAISLAAAVVMKLMNVIQSMGFSIGMAEKIFVFVLMYGAGIDYSLLLISRYREFLRRGHSRDEATASALDATFPAISASAGTDALGILMLIFCQFLIFQTTGPVVAMSLLIAWLAAVTLVPAMMGLMGPKMFWPRRIESNQLNSRSLSATAKLWPAIAKVVTKRPGLVMVVVLVLLAIPATATRKITWVYDALSGIKADWPGGVGNAAAGVEMAKRHWPIGEVAPVVILIDQSADDEKPLTDRQWRALSTKLTTQLQSLEGVQDVRAFTQPLGREVTLANKTMTQQLIRNVAERQYLTADGKNSRLEVLLGVHTMSTRAMGLVSQIRDEAKKTVGEFAPRANVFVGGATAQMIGIRRTTQKDFKLVVVLVLGVIFLIVLVLLRDLLMTIFMVAAIALSYLATLGLCAWAFMWFYGDAGMDWKVEIFLFVVMASVGVDYNIFLATRLAQEAKIYPPKEAIRQAVIHTGPVISSCGLIMAGTLGSLMAGEIELLHQLGFTLSVGMLVDTFVVRPLLLPAFATLFKRTG